MTACKLCNKIPLFSSVLQVSKMRVLSFSWCEFFGAAWVGLTRQTPVDILHRTGQDTVSCGQSNLGCFPSVHDSGGTWNEVTDKSSGDVSCWHHGWMTFHTASRYSLHLHAYFPDVSLVYQSGWNWHCTQCTYAGYPCWPVQVQVTDWGFDQIESVFMADLTLIESLKVVKSTS